MRNQKMVNRAFIIILISMLNSCSECTSIKISYVEDFIEKGLNSDVYTDVDQDSLQINLDDGFHEILVKVKIESTQKTIKAPSNMVLGTTGHLLFKRPKSKATIFIEFNNSQCSINYNPKYNKIHLSKNGCDLEVRHTNRMVYYE